MRASDGGPSVSVSSDVIVVCIFTHTSSTYLLMLQNNRDLFKAKYHLFESDEGMKRVVKSFG